MASKVRIMALIVVPVALLLTLMFGMFLTISPARTVHAISATPHHYDRLSCTRGSGCDGKDPTNYYAPGYGNCDAGSTNEDQITFNGTVILYYNHNCDVWYEQWNDNGTSDNYAMPIYLAVASRIHYLTGLASNLTPTYHSMTIYDGDYRGSVFACLSLDRANSGCVASPFG